MGDNEAGNKNTTYDTTAVGLGLLRVADTLSRKVLPWQAACCPCAVEALRDVRFTSVVSINEEFVSRMTQQLEAKVAEFISRKDEEVDGYSCYLFMCL